MTRTTTTLVIAMWIAQGCGKSADEGVAEDTETEATELTPNGGTTGSGEIVCNSFEDAATDWTLPTGFPADQLNSFYVDTGVLCVNGVGASAPSRPT